MAKTAAAVLTPARRFLMKQSLTLTILIARSHDGFTAVCPALPNCRITASSRSRAYREVKTVIYDRLLSLGQSGALLPTDPVVSVKYLRIDLSKLWAEVELR